MSKGHSCRHCAAKRRSLDKFLASRAKAYAEIASIGLEPLEPYPGTLVPWKSRCLTCGTFVNPSVGNIRAGRTKSCGHGCRQRELPHKWSRQTIAEFAELHGFELHEPVQQEQVGAAAKWHATCSACGTSTIIQPNRLPTNESGCRTCASRQSADRLRTPPDVAVAAMRRVDLEPQVPYINAQTPWPCICTKCGGDCSPTYWSVAQGRGTGLCLCPGGRGIRSDDDAYIYLMESAELGARKVGIGKAGSIRLSTNVWQGFPKVLEVAYCSGARAREVELAILKSIRRRDRGFVTQELMPFGGYRETFPIDGYTHITLKSHLSDVLIGSDAQNVTEMRLGGQPEAAALFTRTGGRNA